MSRFEIYDVNGARWSCENLAKLLILLCEVRDAPLTVSTVADDLASGLRRLRRSVDEASTYTALVSGLFEKTVLTINELSPKSLGKITATCYHSLLVNYGQHLISKSSLITALTEDERTDWTMEGDATPRGSLRNWLDDIQIAEIEEIRTRLAIEAEATIDRLELGSIDDFKPAAWFRTRGIKPSTLRQAATLRRKTKRVRKLTGSDGSVLYSVDDARRAWPSEFGKKPRGPKRSR